jgi:hypothetical protein
VRDSSATRIKDYERSGRIDRHATDVLVLARPASPATNQSGKLATSVVSADLTVVYVIEVECAVTPRRRLKNAPERILLRTVDLPNRELLNQPDGRSPERRTVGANADGVLRRDCRRNQ